MRENSRMEEGNRMGRPLEKHDLPAFRRATGSNFSCVEVGFKDNNAFIRDSRNKNNGAMKVEQKAFSNFTDAIKKGVIS